MANNQYKLQLTLSNGTTVDAGYLDVPQGEKGATGATGDKGATGARGNTIFNGSGAPSTSSVVGAVSGDYYIDNDSLAIYSFNGTSWTNKGTLKGAKGAKGDQGAKGDKGATGATGDKGATGPQGVSVTGATLTIVG